jgi:predicted RNase H-like HicB family nuclease
MRYVVYIESRPAGYEAYVPDLPGCVASGETREEALQRIRETITAHHDGSRNTGKPFRRNRTQSDLAVVDLA